MYIMSSQKTYEAPALSVDLVLFQLIDNQLHTLLIHRANEPFKNMWALPGGYNPKGETTHQAVDRIVKEKAGVNTKDIGLIEQIYTFDTVARDPRGHAVSVTYMGIGKDVIPTATRTTHHPQLFPVHELPDLAFDHGDIVKYAHDCLKNKLAETTAVYALLPKLFTLSQLQTAYEAVLGHPLDKRNFRKRFLGLELLQPTSEFHMSGAHRPAKLYKFKAQKLQTLSKDFS